MYLPLKFLSMMDTYVKVLGAASKEPKLNQKSIDWVEQFMRNKADFFYNEYAQCKDFLIGNRKSYNTEKYKVWKSIAEDYEYKLGLQCPLDEDFLNLMLFTDVRNTWRKSKLVYWVNEDLKQELTNMSMGKLSSVDCVRRLPSNCFYIDWEDGKSFAQKDKGCFVQVCEVNNCVYITTILCFATKGDVGTIISTLAVGGGDYEVMMTTDDDAYEDVIIKVQGQHVHFKEKEFKRFILNFFIYLYATNNNITVSRKTANTYSRPKYGVEPKNQFREVKGYDVGFNYVSPRKDKVIYEGDSHHSYGGKKRTHYRSAHWHSYWVKDGNEKKLVVRWVDGVIVNGSEANKVTVNKL